MTELFTNILSNYGVAGLIFIMWWFTFKKSNEQHQQNFNWLQELFNIVVDLLKDETSSKTILTGQLAELTMLIRGQKPDRVRIEASINKLLDLVKTEEQQKQLILSKLDQIGQRIKRGEE